MVTISCGLTLQICLIIALSFRCRCWRFGFVSGQISLACSIALCTQELYMRPHVLKERCWEENLIAAPWTSSRRFFTCVVVENSKPQAAWEHVSKVSKGSYHQLVRSNLDFPLWSAIQGVCSSLAPCTSVIRVLCQALEPTAFLVHQVLAAFADAHSSATDGAWKLVWTLPNSVESGKKESYFKIACINKYIIYITSD